MKIIFKYIAQQFLSSWTIKPSLVNIHLSKTLPNHFVKVLVTPLIAIVFKKRRIKDANLIGAQ